jgi:hypothetical protein
LIFLSRHPSAPWIKPELQGRLGDFVGAGSAARDPFRIVTGGSPVQSPIGPIAQCMPDNCKLFLIAFVIFS